MVKIYQKQNKNKKPLAIMEHLIISPFTQY